MLRHRLGLSRDGGVGGPCEFILGRFAIAGACGRQHAGWLKGSDMRLRECASPSPTVAKRPFSSGRCSKGTFATQKIVFVCPRRPGLVGEERRTNITLKTFILT